MKAIFIVGSFMAAFTLSVVKSAVTERSVSSDDTFFQREADCIELAQTVHDYVAFMDQRNPYVNITDDIEWSTSVDTTNVTALSRITCGIDGRPLSLVSKYFADSGIALHMVRRMYGYGIFVYRAFGGELEEMGKAYPVNSPIARAAQLAIRAIKEFERRGFFCFDSLAVAEVREKFAGEFFPEPSGRSCQVFHELAEELQAIVEDIVDPDIPDIIQMTGIDISDTANNGRFLCELSAQDSFEGIVDVLSNYGYFESQIAYGLRMLPANVGPITLFEETETLTDEELLERYPYLNDAYSESVATFRERHRLSLSLHRNLKKLADSITRAQAEYDRSSD